MATAVPLNEARFDAWSAALVTGGHVAQASGVSSEEAVALGITTDSRAVRPGGAFVALRGERHDGHGFVADALVRGARLLVVEAGRAGIVGPVPLGVDVVEVPDTLLAWGALARAHLRAWRRGRGPTEPGRVVSITGSAGKTTTKELAAALFRVLGPTLATEGNLNNRIGLPATAFTVEAAHRFVVLEAGMSLPGEIAALASVAEPDVGVVTIVGLAHAAGVGGHRQDVAREKSALLQALPESGTAVVNADDPVTAATLAVSRATTALTFGRAPSADYRLLHRESLGVAGSRVTFQRRGATRPLEVTLPLVGEAAALDLLAALAAVEGATQAPMPGPLVAEALSQVVPTAGRAEVVTVNTITVMDDSYNANPSSMTAALQTLHELAVASGAPRRAVAVLGEMRELGPTAEDEHTRVGDAVAEAGVGLFISAGGLMNAAVARAQARGVAVLAAEGAEETARITLRSVRAGDVVLVKGSRSVGLELVARLLAGSVGGVSAAAGDARRERGRP